MKWKRAIIVLLAGCLSLATTPVSALTLDKRTDISNSVAFAEMAEQDAQTLWEQYLEYLAIFVTNLRMLEDMDIVIGGEISGYLTPYMNEQQKRAAKYDRFARDIDYIDIGRKQDNACAAGAALLALEYYANCIL